ncbi:MAG: NfeD family protein [Acidobacteriota bacterium]
MSLRPASRGRSAWTLGPAGRLGLVFLMLAVVWVWATALVAAPPAVPADATPVEADASEDEAPSDPASTDPARTDSASEDVASTDEPTIESSGTLASDARVFYGELDAQIGRSQAAFVKRLVDAARAGEADALILRLNTFGGAVDAAVAMRDALLSLEAPCIVFIDRRAISAGALISFACDVIAMTPGGTIGSAMPVTGTGEAIDESVREKYLSYFREEMRSTAEASGRDPDIAEAMVDESKVIEGITEEGKILTLGTKRAIELGVADVEVENVDELLVWLGADGPVETVESSWSEDLAGFLTSPAIASLLVLGMFLFGYLEIYSPGFGIFGALAITFALLLFFGHYLVNLAGYEELLLFTIGIVLLAIELVVIPGFGVAGIAGLVSLGAALVMLFMAGDWSDVRFDNPFTLDAIERVATAFLLSGLGLVAMIRFLPRTAAGRRLTLDRAMTRDAGYASHREEEPDLVGQVGVAESTLRPSGKARFGTRRLDVETEGDWIEVGDPIVVLRQVEGRVVVARAPPDETTGPDGAS